MTRYFQLPNGYRLSLHIFKEYPPLVERGFVRTILNPCWAIDEEVWKEVEKEDSFYEWVDERTSE